jgi:hypothetical protein
MPAESSNVQADRSDLLRAVEFAEGQFSRWQQAGLIRPDQYESIRRYYDGLREVVQTGAAWPEGLRLRPADQCWSCRRPVEPGAPACPECGAPAHTPEVQELRHLIFVCHEIRNHDREGRLDLSAAHVCLTDGNERITALRRKLDRERAPLPESGGEPEEVLEAIPVERRRARAPQGPQRNLLEILLDPRSIQWLLASGGALLVLGLVIWLAAAGVFQNKLVVASLLGVGNLALLLGGWAVIRLTRHELAGRALTLLACLLMPLNLWFYDAQGLIPLQQGGHLWIPALVCCVLYAASARVLRDPTFVYVLVGGVTLAGLLLLADQALGRFWEVSAPATLVIALALVSIHVERAFPEGEGPFSRRRFGLAFFWSGHVLLGAGLLLLLGTQVAGDWLFPLFKPLYDRFGSGQPPEIVTDPWGRLLTLGLVLVGTYAYVYSDLVVRRLGVYLHVAVLTLLWAEVLLIRLVTEQFHLPLPLTEVVIIALALTALLANLALARLTDKQSPLLRAGPPLALVLSTLPVVLGVSLHFRATALMASDWSYALGWGYVAAMLVTAVSCRVGAFLYRRSHPGLATTYFFGTAAATLAGAAGLLLVVLPPESRGWQYQAPLLMLIPLAYLVASRFYRGHTPERPLLWVAHAATAVMLVSSLGAAFHGVLLVQGESLNLLLAAFFAEAALFYALAAGWGKHEASVYASALMGCIAVWQLLKYARVPDDYYTVAFALIGLLLLVGYRFALLERFRLTDLARAAFQCGNALLSLAFVAGALMVLSELAHPQPAIRNELLAILSMLLVIALLAVALVRHPDWRRWYVAVSIGNAALIVLVLAVLGQLTVGEKLEIVSVVIGLGLLVAGHLGWYREQGRHSDLVSLSLGLGSLLLALPLLVAVLYCRSSHPDFGTFHTLNELGMLAGGLLLLATGYMFQIRSTTLTGALLTVVYLLSLVLFLRLPEKLQTTAVYLMIGGGVFFGTGLVLSLYRDRLLTLPDRLKRRKGVFRVLTWR